MGKRPAKQGFVYFVTDGECIKIGFATNVRKRIESLQTGCSFPLYLIGYISADRSEETSLHQRFEHLRQRGEWFIITDELLKFVHEDVGITEAPDGEDEPFSYTWVMMMARRLPSAERASAVTPDKSTLSVEQNPRE